MAITSRHKRNINFAMSGMTDIVFLLLIFFMITSTLIAPGTQNVDLPRSNNQTVANPDVSVSITRDMEYFVNGEAIVFSELESSLSAAIEEATISETENKVPTIRLNADENLAWEQIMQFINLAKRNRYKVIMGTRPL